ncbi:GH3 family domain-containing protein [Roseospira navarrensis]|uniref:Auxin-regulated protein n=1 Tax=Roseospira navarrensis TaxID=140058 RepID=A0A7X2D4J3_9PROT|nr:GH3 auxin-responsive promoter family protein [Roseospira navarrensis]MQX36667.1 auxin-regulated protein [Roseospira navarrensis]
MALDVTPALRLWTGLRLRALDRQDAAADQRRTLLGLVDRARDTRFGRDHDFAAIRSVEDFQARVPLRRWEDMWESYWQAAFPVLEDISWPGRVPYFAVTSGTTGGRTKHMPVTRPLLANNRAAARDLMGFHLRRRPDSRVWGGPNMMLGGSTDLTELAPGVRCGDMSGIAAAEMPWFARPLNYPPPDIALIPDWPEKLDRLTADLPGRDIRLLSGTPSWVLVLAERLMEATGAGTLGAVFPNLEVFVHGGVSFAPYRSRFNDLLAGSRAECAEVYPASEGFIAVQDRGPGEGLRMMADAGLFFEFVPVEDLDSPTPRRHWLATAETGRAYALVLSSCGGQWGYVLGDTVRLLETDPPRLLVTGRTSWSLSAFGEHLIAAEVEAAVARASAAAGLEATDWTMGAVVPARSGETGHHRLLIEFAAPPDATALDSFRAAFDRALSAENEDYEAHRVEGLDAPRVTVLPPGRFAAWMAARGKAGGQHKVPRLIGDTAQFSATVRDLVQARATGSG